jgi:hypothetical protein
MTDWPAMVKIVTCLLDRKRRREEMENEDERQKELPANTSRKQEKWIEVGGALQRIRVGTHVSSFRYWMVTPVETKYPQPNK